MKISKWFEHFVKNAVSLLLRTGLKQKPRIPQPPYKRILFLRFDALGDMILSFPIFRATRTALPDSKIDVLCSPQNITILKGSNLANTLLVAGKNPLNLVKLMYRIRRKNYDVVVNLVTRPSFTFGLLARLGGPKSVRIAGEQQQFSYFYNRIIDLPPKGDIHMLKRKFMLCKDFLDPEISHIDKPWVTYDTKIKDQAQILFKHALTSLNITRQKPRLAGLNLSAGLKRREWPLEKNELFLQKCIEKYKDKIDGWIIFTDPNKPKKTGELVEKLIHLNRTKTGEISNPTVPSFPVAIPAQSDMRVIMEFLVYLTVLITPDTSITHAASAMGTPVLVLTIGENENVWNPIGVKHKIVFSDEQYSLESLDVEKVMSGFDELIKQVSI